LNDFLPQKQELDHYETPAAQRNNDDLPLAANNVEEFSTENKEESERE